MKNQKNETTTKTKETTIATKKTRRNTHKTKDKKETHTIFLNDTSKKAIAFRKKWHLTDNIISIR